MLDFTQLRLMSVAELQVLGFRMWDKEPNDDNELLWLIPKTYFNQIPQDTPLESIDALFFDFDIKEASDDDRAGLLSFGFRRMIEAGE